MRLTTKEIQAILDKLHKPRRKWKKGEYTQAVRAEIELTKANKRESYQSRADHHCR